MVLPRDSYNKYEFDITAGWKGVSVYITAETLEQLDDCKPSVLVSRFNPCRCGDEQHWTALIRLEWFYERLFSSCRYGTGPFVSCVTTIERSIGARFVGHGILADESASNYIIIGLIDHSKSWVKRISLPEANSWKCSNLAISRSTTD